MRPATFIDDSPELVDAKKGKKDHHNKGHGNGHRHGRKGDWQTVEGEGYGGEYSYVVADGKGEPSATWTLEGLEPGKTYQVLVTWVVDPANATSTTWTIADGSGGGVLLSISDMDQTELRADATLGGQTWQSLAIVTATSGAIVVRLEAAGSSGRVVADAVAVVEVGETMESGQNGGDGEVVLAAAVTNDPPAKTWFGWLGGRFGKAESERFRARDQALADLQVESHPYANLPLRPEDIQAYDDATGIPVAGPIIQFTYGDMVRPRESRKAAANAGVQVAVGVTAKVLSASRKIAAPTLKGAGKIADVVPRSVPKNWSREVIENAIIDYEHSIAIRKAEVAAFDAVGGGRVWARKAHIERIVQEESFLHQLKRALEEMR